MEEKRSELFNKHPWWALNHGPMSQVERKCVADMSVLICHISAFSWIVMRFVISFDIHGFQRFNFTNFGDPLTFCRVQCQHSEQLQQHWLTAHGGYPGKVKLLASQLVQLDSKITEHIQGCPYLQFSNLLRNKKETYIQNLPDNLHVLNFLQYQKSRATHWVKYKQEMFKDNLAYISPHTVDTLCLNVNEYTQNKALFLSSVCC